MKIRISYFYQIRNFKKNMIPMNTAIWDPQWYHAGLGHQHTFYDKRGILNGLRLLPIITQAQGEGLCPCKTKNPSSCKFLQHYRTCLERIDFEKMMRGIEGFAKQYKIDNNIQEEIIMVLIVYDLNNNFICECSSTREAARKFNTNSGSVCRVCNGKIKHSKGFIFKYDKYD